MIERLTNQVSHRIDAGWSGESSQKIQPSKITFSYQSDSKHKVTT